MSRRDATLLITGACLAGGAAFLYSRYKVYHDCKRPQRFDERTRIDNNPSDLEMDGGRDDISTDEVPADPPPYSPGSQFEFDAVILHSDDNFVKAKACREKLCQFGNIAFLDDVLTPGSPLLGGIAELLHSCRLVVILHTREYVNDGLMNFASDINHLQALEEDKHRIIPVLGDDENLCRVLRRYIPVEYDDDNFQDKMRKLFEKWRIALP